MLGSDVFFHWMYVLQNIKKVFKMLSFIFLTDGILKQNVKTIKPLLNM